MRSLFRSHSCNFLQIFVLWALLLSHLSRNVLGDDGDGDDDDNDDDDGYGFDSPLNATDPHDINRVYAVGDTIDVSWESPFDAVKLAFIAEDSPLLHFFSQNNKEGEFHWLVNVNDSGSSSPFYYLYFENEYNNTEHYYSALFRVNDGTKGSVSTSTAPASITVTPTPKVQASQTTIGTATAVITELITPLPQTSERSIIKPSAAQTVRSTTSAASGASSTRESNSVAHGLSQGSKVGIGVGVSLGIIAVAGLALLSMLRSRRCTTGGGDGYGIEQSPLAHASDNAGIAGAEGCLKQPSAYAQHSAKLANTSAAPTSDLANTSMQGSSPMAELPGRYI